MKKNFFSQNQKNFHKNRQFTDPTMRSNKIEAKKRKSGDLPHIFHFSYLSHTISYICFLPKYRTISTLTITHFFLSLFYGAYKKTNVPRPKRTNTFCVSFVLARSFFSSSFFRVRCSFDSFVLFSFLFLVWLRRVGIQFKCKKNKIFLSPAWVFSFMVSTVDVLFVRCRCYFSCVIFCVL